MYFAQYPLLSLIMWGNKTQTLSISLLHEVMALWHLSAPGWGGGAWAGQAVRR